MAPFSEQVRKGIQAALYGYELQRLWSSYQAAQDALAHVRDRIEKDLAARWATLTPDDDPDTFDDLERDYEEFQGRELPALFLIGMYHAFERHAAKWMKRPGEQVTFNQIAVWFIAEGNDLDKQAMSAIALAANCAKHGPGKSAERLFKLRPDWFRNGTTRANADASRLEVTGERLEAMYRTLLKASPRGVEPF